MTDFICVVGNPGSWGDLCRIHAADPDAPDPSDKYDRGQIYYRSVCGMKYMQASSARGSMTTEAREHPTPWDDQVGWPITGGPCGRCERIVKLRRAKGTNE